MTFIVCVFFFKQNTVYELRISDWSSDVCSSDLNKEEPGTMTKSLKDFNGRMLLVGCGNMAGAMLGRWLKAGVEPAAVTIVDPFAAPRQRTSVGEGKSESVRVELGGRGLIKQKTITKLEVEEVNGEGTNRR